MNEPERFKGYVRCDPAKSVSLHDVGGDEYHAVVMVGPNDFEYPVLIDMSSTAERLALEVPEHEENGPLPPHWWDRVWGNTPSAKTAHYCGQPNRRGKPCRAVVREPDQACRWHIDRN